MDPLKIVVSPPNTSSTLAHTRTQTQTHTQNNRKSIGFPLLISGCHFSVVYLILSFCLYPSIVPPHLPAFVRSEGGHLSSMLPLPSSLSSQTTMVASVWLRNGKTLFACVSICEAVCVPGVDNRDALLFLIQMLGPSYLYQLFGGWRLLLLMYFNGENVFLWWSVAH